MTKENPMCHRSVRLTSIIKRNEEEKGEPSYDQAINLDEALAGLVKRRYEKPGKNWCRYQVIEINPDENLFIMRVGPKPGKEDPSHIRYIGLWTYQPETSGHNFESAIKIFREGLLPLVCGWILDDPEFAANEDVITVARAFMERVAVAA